MGAHVPLTLSPNGSSDGASPNGSGKHERYEFKDGRKVASGRRGRYSSDAAYHYICKEISRLGVAIVEVLPGRQHQPRCEKQVVDMPDPHNRAWRTTYTLWLGRFGETAIHMTVVS
jgi:hypothetical protein